MDNKNKIKPEDARPFEIYNGERPKVLLIGNGIPRAYGGENSWDDFLESISEKSYPSYLTKGMPMPLKATMISKNNLFPKLKNFIKKDHSSSWGFSVEPKEKEFLKKLLSLNFDYILTTNYAMEIECALLDIDSITPKQIDEIRRCYGDTLQKKFLINTFNYFGDNKPSVWHVHGDVFSPVSIALNNEIYGKLTGKYYECINKKAAAGKKYIMNYNKKEEEKITSWIDAFLLGDLYILGFGMAFSETDLWWLLEYKSKKFENNKKVFGSTTFFDKDLKKETKKDPLDWCKRELFEILNVKVEDCGYDGNDYKVFYKKAYEYLKKEVGEKTKK